MPYAVGALTLIVIWLLYAVITGKWGLVEIFMGEDGRPSTSKFQWFLWTGVILFSYAAVFAVKVVTGQLDQNTVIPENVLLAMGFTTATMAVAKKVGSAGKKETVAQLVAQKKPVAGTGLAGIIVDDDGNPDLSKIQMLTWTSLAVVAYIFALTQQIGLSGPVIELPDVATLPNIDSTLMALMGLGQGGYLGKKIAEMKPAPSTSP